jgi:hypothetical protein
MIMLFELIPNISQTKQFVMGRLVYGASLGRWVVAWSRGKEHGDLHSNFGMDATVRESSPNICKFISGPIDVHDSIKVA